MTKSDVFVFLQLPSHEVYGGGGEGSVVPLLLRDAARLRDALCRNVRACQSSITSLEDYLRPTCAIGSGVSILWPKRDSGGLVQDDDVKLAHHLERNFKRLEILSRRHSVEDSTNERV